MTDEHSEHPVTVSREKLYKQVCEKAMSRLAADYGISGNGLAKIGDRLAISYPSRGYWARKSAGPKVAQIRLPDPKDDTLSEVTTRTTRSKSHRPRATIVAPARHHRRLDRGTTAPARGRTL